MEETALRLGLPVQIVDDRAATFRFGYFCRLFLNGGPPSLGRGTPLGSRNRD
jgi:hypothetical protein